MKVTKEESRRYSPFKFTYKGHKSWFYISGNNCSFHQETSTGQHDIWGLSVNRLVSALKACGYIK